MSDVEQAPDGPGESHTKTGTAYPVFSYLLSRFRKARNCSQEELATDADTTPRYISFLENGRANASCVMIERLAAALELETTNHRRLLEAGGFAPQAHVPEHDAPAHTAEITDAARTLLASHHPHPGFCMDPDWNILAINAEAERLMRLSGYTAKAEKLQGYNLIEVTLDPDGLKPVIVNWEEYAWYCLCCLEQQAMRREEPQRILERIRGLPDIQRIETWDRGSTETSSPIGHVQMREDDRIRSYRGIRCSFDDPTDTIARQTRLGLLFPVGDEMGTPQEQSGPSDAA